MIDFRHRPRAALAVLIAALAMPGCGGAESAAPPVPRTVPPGAVAVVGAEPVSRASFEHWLPILRRARGRGSARRATVAFLVKAQWLLQEAEMEGVDHEALDKLVSRRSAAVPPGPGMTAADRAFQARLDLIAEALQRRHGDAPGEPSARLVRRYYRAHRSQFRTPAVRHTLMVVTRARGAALAARAALERGRPWANVARRFSVDSSAAVGGRYAVVRGLQSPALVQAAFEAPRGRLFGPLRAPATAAPRPRYYVFKVTGATPPTLRPLAEVAAEIRSTLEELRGRRALASFERAFLRRWRRRTLCAPGYLVPQCRNYAAKAHG